MESLTDELVKPPRIRAANKNAIFRALNRKRPYYWRWTTVAEEAERKGVDASRGSVDPLKVLGHQGSVM